MKNFCIITNNNKDKDYVLSKKSKALLLKKAERALFLKIQI